MIRRGLTVFVLALLMLLQTPGYVSTPFQSGWYFGPQQVLAVPGRKAIIAYAVGKALQFGGRTVVRKLVDLAKDPATKREIVEVIREHVVANPSLRSRAVAILREIDDTLPIASGPVATVRATLGRKLDYFFGKATGNAHNVERSTGMLRHLERIGLPDTPGSRQYLTEHLDRVLGDPASIFETQANGFVKRHSLLEGPNGLTSFETVWDGNSLITGILGKALP